MCPSSKPSLVLLSGLLCDDLVWECVKQQLHNIVDTQSFSFAGFTSISDMADEVLQKAPPQFSLAGHSMGGRVALEVIRKAPERVERLALLNTGVHPCSNAEIPGRQRLLELAFNEGMDTVVDNWLPPMMSPKGLENDALMAELRAMVLRHTADDFNGEIQALLNRPDAEAVLAKISVPTLLLSGSEDNWSPPAQHRDIQQKIANSELVIIDGVGHMSTVEAPEKIALAFRHWLSK